MVDPGYGGWPVVAGMVPPVVAVLGGIVGGTGASAVLVLEQVHPGVRPRVVGLVGGLAVAAPVALVLAVARLPAPLVAAGSALLGATGGVLLVLQRGRRRRARSPLS